MMKTPFRVAIVLLSAAVLQRGLVSQLPIFGVRGDLLLLLAVVAGLTLGPDRGAIVGFAAGLTFDLLLQEPMGLRALVFCLIGFAAGRYQASVSRASRGRLAITVALASAAGYGLLAVAGWMLGRKGMMPDHLGVIILVVSLINALLAPLAVRALRWAYSERLPKGLGVSYGH